MPRTVIFAAAVFALFAAASVLLTREEARGQTTVNVEVGDLYFCNPSQVGVCETSISVGDTVNWQVVSGTHTVTECDDSFATCPPAGGFNSGNLTSPNSFSHVFNAAGSFEYHCNIHPGMQGRIIVAASAQATPTPSASATPSQTGGGGQTASPSQTVVPAAVPATGGPPENGGSSLLLVIAGGALMAASGAAGVRLLRRHQPAD